MPTRKRPEKRARTRPQAHPGADPTFALRESLARNLTAARTALALSQAALASRAELSRDTVIQVESARADPRLSTLVALARALETSPLLLLVGRADFQALTHTHTPALRRRTPRAPWLPQPDADLIDALHASDVPRNRARAVRLTAKCANRARLSAPAIVASAIGTLIEGPRGAEAGAKLGAALSTSGK
jgi:transcriptional regulator with XRE-family HTH domain